MSGHTEPFGEGAVSSLLDGRYELRMELGRGATGIVSEAFDHLTSEVVAVKVLHPHLLSSASARRRFLREARSAGLLSHPHSVAVKRHNCGPDGDAYLVMERLFGVTLTTLLAGEPLPQLRAIRIVAQVLEAAAAAHRLNLLHRDLKPNNVMLIDRDGNLDFVQVCDFGLAKSFDCGPVSSLLTGHGEVCGTPAYMAPEQARGEALDARADIYSVAVMLFQSVVGRPPFQASSPFALASLHISSPAPRPSQVRPDIAFFPPLENLILRALSKDKVERPSSADVFRADLLQIERDYRACNWDEAPGREAATLAPAPRPARPRRLAFVAALLAVGAAASLVAWRRPPAPRTHAVPAVASIPAPPNRQQATDNLPPATPVLPASAPASPTVENAPLVRPAPARVARPHRVKQPPTPDQEKDDVEATLRAAEQRLAAGAVAEACALGQVAAERAPQSPAPWEFLGRCHMRIPDPVQARAYYHRYLLLAPAGAKASFIRAIVEQRGP